MVFIKVVTEAQQIFGPQALNMDDLKQRFAVVMKENYEKFFVKASVQQAMQMQNPQVQANALGAPAPSNQPNNPPQPTGNPMRQPIRPIQATQTIQ